MNNIKFSHYTTEYISGVMSLRTPQKRSLEILADIVNEIKLKNRSKDLITALSDIRNKYPTCTDFEKDFISLTFALATGVGKTRLMGAFISYLYTRYNIKNFFVVAPNSTIIREIVITEDGMNYKINHSFLPFHEDSIFLTSEEALRYGKTIWKIELEEGEIQNDNTSN